tara:strand:- start:386 stop:703 length:318 start_codon:yes stop_codon:yes gene_type:complete
MGRVVMAAVYILAGMGMGVPMMRAVSMFVNVKMDALAHHSPQNLATQDNQHGTDGKLQPICHGTVDIRAQDDRRTGNDCQSTCMPHTPNGTMTNDPTPRAFATDQ